MLQSFKNNYVDIKFYEPNGITFQSNLFYGYYLEIYKAINLLSKSVKSKWYRTEWLNFVAKIF